jgi:hypothetical protein
MIEPKPRAPGPHDLDSQATRTFEEACGMPDGPERTDALKKANQFCTAADTYGWLFSKELRAPD